MSKCQTNSKSFIGCRFIDTIDTDSDKVEIYDVIDHAIARAMITCRSVSAVWCHSYQTIMIFCLIRLFKVFFVITK